MTSTPTPVFVPSSNTSSNPKPTLLTFHGGGSNATIHTVQLARLTRHLKSHFNFIHLDAPFASAAGPGVLPFFEGCGPFKRWVPPGENPTTEDWSQGNAGSKMSLEVETLVREQVQNVRAEGGDVVGAIGFSQGTRIVAGLLLAAEIHAKFGQKKKEYDWLSSFKFGLSICGSYPPPLLPAAAENLLPEQEKENVVKGRILAPTLHVLGKQDEWEWAGRMLIEQCYGEGEGKSKVFEFEMGHHYPVAVEENEWVRDWVLEAYDKIKASS